MCDKAYKSSFDPFQVEDQTTAARPSRLSPCSISPPRARLSLHTSITHSETMVDAEPDVESGVYLKPGNSHSVERQQFSLGGTQFAGVEPFKIDTGTDIVSFCCRVRMSPILSNARITHIQARKSHRLPFLHEYILVFFTTERDQCFVLRIDRPGKIGTTFTGRQHGIAPNTAIQEVVLYRIEDARSDIDSPDGAWLEMDGKWGSKPIATLATWKSERESGRLISHHLQAAMAHNGPGPKLRDVSKLLEAILLEMPTYRLTTTNCYIMTRSSLLLLQHCYPKAFACHLGSMTGELIPSSGLVEPVWARIFKWHLPFVVLFVLLYIPPVVVLQAFLGTAVDYCNSLNGGKPHMACRLYDTFRIAIHAIVDGPLLIGLLHAYMTSLEEQMNGLVVKLLPQFSVEQTSQQDAIMPSKPFSFLIEGPGRTFLALCILGCFVALFVFFSLTLRYALLAMLLIALFLGVWFNFTYPGSDHELSREVDDVFILASENSENPGDIP